MTGLLATGRAAACAALLCGALAGCAQDEQLPPGPLQVTSGEVSMMLAPMPGPAFGSVSPCLDADEAATVQLVDVTPIIESNAGDAEVRVAWLTPRQRLRMGAGGLDQLEEPFDADLTGSGKVHPCGDGGANTGLELAIVVPPAEDTAVVVDGLDVTYEIDGTRYQTHGTVTVGMCAAEPDDIDAEPTDCQ